MRRVQRQSNAQGAIRFDPYLDAGRERMCCRRRFERCVVLGQAKVIGGTSAFAHVRGTLSFTGKYVRSTNAVTISLKGRITY